MVKPQDVKTVLGVAASNPEGRLLAWRHLKAHWPTLQDIFGNASFMMGNLISAVTAHLSTPYDYFDVSFKIVNTKKSQLKLTEFVIKKV